MTTITKPPQSDFFRTAPAKGIVGKIDREKRIIYGASIIQLGDINDSRPWRVDQATLEQTVAMGNANPRGLKARFTHPDMSNDGMGKYLGRWKNLRIDGDRVRGDLHIAKTAMDVPPNGGKPLGLYVMDLADEDPESFGTSVAPRNDEKAMADAKKAQTDPNQRTPIRFAKLYAADVVDEPAATRGGFFASPWDDSSPLSALPAQASAVLDRYFANAAPDVIRSRVLGYLDKYLSHKEPNMSGTTAEKTGDAAGKKKDPISLVFNEELGRYELPEGVKPEDLGLAAAAPAKPADSPAPTTPPATPPALSDVQKENTRVREIQALCDQAGCPDLAKTMVADLNCTVDLARKNVLDAVLAKRHALPPEEGSNGNAPKPTTDEKLGAEFDAAAAQYLKAGVTKEMYIASRKVSLGLATLTPSTN